MCHLMRRLQMGRHGIDELYMESYGVFRQLRGLDPFGF